ncbi:adenosine receptor A2b-like [Exaiptasia diaphana]|uniref:G-protein coupled receptors family 1 profile domain-containing protein n=1 Tax=Exaiptasia diaphana TaxID=2652724 RepID=A0A913Y812_EXADI|nr:adenosine receptor A2b-like [Exaiptasia diaphana]
MANNSTSFVDISRGHAVCFMSVPTFDPYDTINRPDSIYPNWAFLATLNGIASLPTAFINALIIWVVVENKNLRSSAFNVLLASLAVTDFLVGLLIEPTYCLLLACLLNECYSPCQFTAYVLLTLACCGTTVVTFAIATAERYLAIEHPNFYLNNVTGKRVLIATMIFWAATLGISIACSTFMNKNHPHLAKVPFMVVISVSVLIILYCTSKVQLTAYRQRKDIAHQQESTQQPDKHQQQENRLVEYKKVSMTVTIVVMSFLFYMPLIITTVIEALRKDVSRDFKYHAVFVCLTFVHLQSLIIPIILSLRLSYIREGIKNKLVCFTGN